MVKPQFIKILMQPYTDHLQLGPLNLEGIRELMVYILKLKLTPNVTISPDLIEEVKTQSQGIYCRN